ncbi:SSI family serine proteinase inhibitor [Kitasatospora sp. NPDC002040]|uniref:SSI family serine proteinase inhibitor n=1 Tax=Kitasatospora sp. NPDC002040 TaxID=3154661 RepID=UPI00332BB172
MTTRQLHRRQPYRRLLPVALGLAAACAVVPAPASARVFPSTQAQSALVLTVSRGEVVAPDAARTTLDCTTRPGGSHPVPAKACAALAEADGDLDRLTGLPGTACSALYDPVTATAEGTWRGIPVKWARTFGNSCALRAATAPVF